MENTEIAVIGAGPAGYVAAIRAAQLGKKVALIEANKLGGVCMNDGCIPSKAMIYAASFLDKIKKASNMGIMVQDAHMDFLKMQDWKDSILSKLEKGIETLCNGNKITIIKGTAKFQSSNKLSIQTEEGEKELQFEKAIIATGSKPVELPQFPFDQKTILSSTEALHLKEIPKNLTVIGAGYIGLELGTVYAKLGSKVTVLEMTNQILPGNDSDVVQVVQKNLLKMNIDVMLESKATKFENGKITIETKEGEQQIDSDCILVAVGRIPNSQNLGLENTKVKTDDKGFIQVSNQLKTDDDSIYAIGDLSIGPMLAHKASHQGKAVAEIIAGQQEYQESHVPAVIFTDPEIATVGLSEEQAKQQGIEITKGKFPFSVSSRAMTKSETAGFVKIIADKDKKSILGVQIVGADASDLIGEATLAIKKGTTLEELAETIHPHPTLSESLQEAAEATLGKATHILNIKL